MVKAALGSLVFVIVVGFLAPRESRAQYFPPQRPVQVVNLEGPRFGVTMLSDSVREKLKRDVDTEVGSVITQFGWQKEKQFLANSNGLSGVTELVLLVGGLEQGVFLPSANWLVGMRTATGFEFAVGPNVTAAGVALAAATGVTVRAGDLNIPLNFAAVRSKSGLRVSLLAGFNMRRP